MARYLKLERSDMSVVFVEGRTPGYRMTVEVLEAVDVDSNIFVYQREPFGPAGYTDVCVNIASPADLEEYPVGGPTPPAGVFFRLDKADYVFRNSALAEAAWQGITREVAELLRALDHMDTLKVTEIVEFGTSPSSSSSSGTP